MHSSTDPIERDDSAEIESDEELSNAAWDALTGAQASLAQRNDNVVRYRPEFAPFGAAAGYSQANVAKIAATLAFGERLALFFACKPEAPSDLDIVREELALQMVATREHGLSRDCRVLPLGEEDRSVMLQLVALTQPGPFGKRTHEMGNYFGIREGGQLVAIAGERMVARKYVEVSAVCTHPDWRGRGLAKILIQHLCATIVRRQSTPFLHVLADNLSAIQIYKELGFRNARKLHLTVVMPLSKSPS